MNGQHNGAAHGDREDEVNSIVDRLNAEKRPWSFEVVSHIVRENEVVVLGRLTLDGVAKMAFGSTTISRDASGRMSIGADLKTSANESLARAARLMGVGLVYTPARASEDVHAAAPAVVAPAVRAPANPGDRITQKQMGALQGLARRRNIGREHFAGMLQARFAKTELLHLTKAEASTFLTELAETNGHASP